MSSKLYLVSSRPVVLEEDDVKKAFQEELIQQYRDIIPIRYVKDAVCNFNSSLSHYLPWMHDRNLYLWEIKPDIYDDFSKCLTDNVEKPTAVNYNCYLSNLYEWAISRKKDEIKNRFGIDIVNPIDKWNTPRRAAEEEELPPVPDNEVVHYYFEKEKDEFNEAVRSNNKRIILLLGKQLVAEQIMKEAGLRVKEVSKLNLGNIDLEHMIITVIKGKGNKDRIVDINKRLGPILKWYLDNIYPLLIKDINKEDILDQPLLISERKTRMSRTTIQYHLWKQQEAYNVPLDKRFSPHGLRRLFATNLYMELCEMNYPDPLFYIKGQLGHVFLSTTIRYVQVSQAYLSRIRLEAEKQIAERFGDKG